MLLRYGKKY